MNNVIYINSIRFFLLLLIHISICNHINFLGYINPYIYILVIAYFPIKNNRLAIILLSFLLGITVDTFQDSGGMHAAACVFIAYLRPFILKFSFGIQYEHQSIKFNSVNLSSKIIYIVILTIMHHIVLFSLEIFNISKIILILQKTLFSSIFTIIVCILISIIFSKRAK